MTIGATASTLISFDGTDEGLGVQAPPEARQTFQAGDCSESQLRTMRFRRAGTSKWLLHPTLAFADATWTPVREQPGVDLRWDQTLIGGPMGTLDISHRFEGGVKRRSEFTSTTTADVHTTMTYRSVLCLMDGRVGALDAFEQGGHIEGDWSAILLLGGICDQATFRTAMAQAIGDLADPLIRMCDGYRSRPG